MLRNSIVPEITDINFGDLTVVEIDYIEMERQIRKISDLSIEAQNNILTYNSAISKLASLLSVEIPMDLEQIQERINNLGTYDSMDMSTTLGKMRMQIEMFKKLNEDISTRFNMLASVVANTEEWVYSGLNFDGTLMGYNEILALNRKTKKYEELLGDYTIDEEELMEMANAGSNHLQTTDFYGAIEKEYGLNAGEGKTFVEDIFATIQANPNLTSKEKAAQQAYVLCKMSYESGAKFPYVRTDHHAGYDLDTVCKNSDCSSYVTYLLKQGNPDIKGGGTGWLASPSINPRITCMAINGKSNGLDNLQPGDIIVRAGNGDSSDHAMYFLGYDNEGRLICTENYGGDKFGNSGGTRVAAYDEKELYNYYGYSVDYD